MYRAAIAGLLVGVVAGLSRVHLAGPVDVHVNSISTWLIVPFAMGALATTTRTAAAQGALASLALLAGFYAVTTAFGSPLAVAFWAAAALTGGATFGVAGHRKALLLLAVAFVIEGVLDTGPLSVAAGVVLAGVWSRQHLGSVEPTRRAA